MIKWSVSEPTIPGEYLVKVLDIPTQEFHIAIAEVIEIGWINISDYQPSRQNVTGYIPVKDLLNI